MASTTFNKAIDYFKLVADSSPKLKLKSSNENRSKQNTSGPNTPGDPIVVDAYGETAAPSAEYEVIADMTAADLPVLGKVIAAADANLSIGGTAHPVCLGGISISTRTGSAPTFTANGQAIQVGGTQKRWYDLATLFAAFALSTRHRAQDFLGLCTIKKGSSAASPIEDYGLSSVNANFPIAFSLAQPQGEILNYDLHGDMVTVDYTMNWYAATEPTIELANGVPTNTTITNPKGRTDPENGYTQYTWQVSIPLVGSDSAPTSND